jgi:hypothetical protein
MENILSCSEEKSVAKNITTPFARGEARCFAMGMFVELVNKHNVAARSRPLDGWNRRKKL